MNKDKIIKISIISLVTLLILSILGLSYAYFSLLIKGKSNNMVTQMGSLRLKYVDDNVITLNNIFPGDSVSKAVTVTNIGTLNASYNLVWEELQNGFVNDELVIEAKCTKLNSEGVEDGTCDDVLSMPIDSNKIKSNIMIEPGFTHKYDIKITFIETGESQNYNKNADFNGKIGLVEGINNTPVYCYYDGDITTGAEFLDGPYRYRYNQIPVSSISVSKSGYTEIIPATFMNSSFDEKYSIKKVKGGESAFFRWQDVELNGWSVSIADRKSSSPVTGRVCTYINDTPVVSMTNMFAYSDTQSITFSNINTSNIIDMSSMFAGTVATSLDVSGFDTSNVVDMSNMFDFSDATTIDVSGFNTSKVTNMNSMFERTKVVKLDLSSFDTSNVKTMINMFLYSSVNNLNIKSFNTSNVTNMSGMFRAANATALDLSSFNTSKVTDMSNMFYDSEATEIKGLNGFDTSNVTNMSGMFYGTDRIKTLDVSNFNTSKVTNMSKMFGYSSTKSIVGLNKFDTSNVTNMSQMFYGLDWTSLDLSNFDTSKVTDMSRMFFYCRELVTIYVSDKFVTTLLPDDITIFGYNDKLVGGAGTVYNYQNSDKEYARIDGGTSKPGYFTLKTT